MARRCPECGEDCPTMKALHWHLRCEHDYDKEQAYVVAGAIDYEHGTGAKLGAWSRGKSPALRAEAHERMDEIIARAKNQPFDPDTSKKWNVKVVRESPFR